MKAKDIDLSLVGSEIKIIAPKHPWAGKVGIITGSEDWGKKEGHAFLVAITVDGKPWGCRVFKQDKIEVICQNKTK